MMLVAAYFIVGEYKQCDESFSEMLSYPENCYATDGSCFIELDTIYNVRDASLSLRWRMLQRLQLMRIWSML
jgi:hypothetical protein